jgi:hypothetical protein
MWYFDWTASGVAIAAAVRGVAIGAAARGAAIGAAAILVYALITPGKASGLARAQAKVAVRTT